ncbi:hypothetical protein COO60DRAFT_1523236 [Scenedesmus sp. NREL 46B-D3]|nr:hypothetical protein COO60DRAFT_1523236 [Scenedesmus sp. NREL 46B-D3]
MASSAFGSNCTVTLAGSGTLSAVAFRFLGGIVLLLLLLLPSLLLDTQALHASTSAQLPYVSVINGACCRFS